MAPAPPPDPAASNDRPADLPGGQATPSGRARPTRARLAAAERRATRAQKLSEALIEIGRALARLDEPEALYREACRLIVEVAGFSAALIALEEAGEPPRLVPAAAAGAFGPLALGGPGALDPDAELSAAMQAALARVDTVVTLASGAPGPRASSDGQRGGPRRPTLAIPLRVDERSVGVVVVQASEAREFRSREVHLLERVVDDLGSRVESVRRERQRRAAEARFRMLVESAPVPIEIHRAAGSLYANPAYAALVGASSKEAALGVRPPDPGGTPGGETAPGADDAAPDAADEPLEPYEGRLVRMDGANVPVRVDRVRVELADGPAIAAFLTDLTERRTADETIRESEQRYRALVEQAADAILVVDASGHYLEVNAAACEMLGYTRDEMLARSVRDIVDPADHARLEAELASMFVGETVRSERRMRRRDGSIVIVEMSGRQLPDGRLQATMRDITARRKVEVERDRLAAAVEQGSEVVLMTDADGRVVYVNPAFTALTGLTPAALIGRRPSDVMRQASQPAEVSAAIDEARAGGRPFSGRVLGRRADGSPAELDLVISPRRDANGTIVGSVEVARDVTREQALEAQLRQAQKMEAVGRLAGGIAHDFNNLLTAIRGYGSLLAERIEPGTSDAPTSTRSAGRPIGRPTSPASSSPSAAGPCSSPGCSTSTPSCSSWRRCCGG